jgi:imidazolonepropionase-like amidohydrolase
MMIKTRIRAVLIALLVVSSSIALAAQETRPQPGKKIILRAAKLLDVKTGTTLSDQVVVIQSGKITAVGSAESLKADVDAERIELSNAIVLPGLIDCHVHLTGNPNQLDLGPAGLHISYPRRALIGARNARITLEAGFTTVRNVGADGYTDVALRDAINAGDVTGPHAGFRPCAEHYRRSLG